MCLLVIAWQSHSRYRLVVAANRDEFHERPTAPMAKWPLPNDILAGRDLRANGTWLALDRRRRFGVVTNFRDLQRPRPGAPSRGALIPSYLGGSAGAGEFLAAIAPQSQAYSGFNLLLADADSLWYACNRMDLAVPPATRPEPPSGIAAQAVNPLWRSLPPGVYGLSNQFLDTPWPKLRRVRKRFEAWLGQTTASTEDLFAMLDDRTTVDSDEDLPRTGLTPDWERILSAPFVLNPDYGTRCSSVLLLEHSDAFTLIERRFERDGRQSGESKWALQAGDWPRGPAPPA
jgi:uncharacterized protein with NRDE domain